MNLPKLPTWTIALPTNVGVIKKLHPPTDSRSAYDALVASVAAAKAAIPEAKAALASATAAYEVAAEQRAKISGLQGRARAEVVVLRRDLGQQQLEASLAGTPGPDAAGAVVRIAGLEALDKAAGEIPDRTLILLGEKSDAEVALARAEGQYARLQARLDGKSQPAGPERDGERIYWV